MIVPDEPGDAQIRAHVDSLIVTADAALAGTSANRNRMACWMARSALEALVLRILVLHGLRAGRSSMRSQLACLDVAVVEPPGLVARLDYTWARLSNACHHHAYQLDPSIVEVRHLIDNVRAIQTATDGMAR